MGTVSLPQAFWWHTKCVRHLLSCPQYWHVRLLRLFSVRSFSPNLSKNDRPDREELFGVDEPVAATAVKSSGELEDFDERSVALESD